ncbi:MAG: flagellar hook-basal body complex protein FliE [Rhodothermaceae bacterium]
MKIGGINSGLSDLQKLQKVNENKNSSFGDMMADFVKDVNKDQLDSKQITTDFVEGTNDVELHDVMVSGQKAKTSLELLMQVRNKALDMYKEITRMQ